MQFHSAPNSVNSKNVHFLIKFSTRISGRFAKIILLSLCFGTHTAQCNRLIKRPAETTDTLCVFPHNRCGINCYDTILSSGRSFQFNETEYSPSVSMHSRRRSCDNKIKNMRAPIHTHTHTRTRWTKVAINHLILCGCVGDQGHYAAKNAKNIDWNHLACDPVIPKSVRFCDRIDLFPRNLKC